MDGGLAGNGWRRPWIPQAAYLKRTPRFVGRHPEPMKISPEYQMDAAALLLEFWLVRFLRFVLMLAGSIKMNKCLFLLVMIANKTKLS